MDKSLTSESLRGKDPIQTGEYKLGHMAVPKKLVKTLQERDQHCWHCGAEGEMLVPHHRRGRGIGGSKLLDTPENLMMICGQWNGDLESDLVSMRRGRGWGHKLSFGDSFDMPVFDLFTMSWWTLLPDGTKVRLEVSETY